MTRHSEPPPARARWNPSRQRIFISVLFDTGSVASAARAAGMSRSSAHRLRERLAGTPFDRAWDQALDHYARKMANPFGPANRVPGPDREGA
jgi:hypothetical protein